MPLTWSPLSPAIGALVEGLDLRQPLLAIQSSPDFAFGPKQPLLWAEDLIVWRRRLRSQFFTDPLGGSARLIRLPSASNI